MASYIPKPLGTTSAFRSISNVFGKGIHRAAKISTRNPIEMIATILILSSFTYFYLYNLARTSDIFSGTVTRLYPTFVYADKNSKGFQQLTRTESSKIDNSFKVQLKQISIKDENENIMDKETLSTVLHFQNTVANTLLDEHVGQFGYQALCFKDNQGECFSQPISSLFDLSTLDKQDVVKVIQQYPELAKSAFGDLNLNTSSASSIYLSFAFNASTDFRQELAYLWEQKVATLSFGKLESLSTTNNQQDVFTWLFIVTRNILLRLKELIQVRLGNY